MTTRNTKQAWLDAWLQAKPIDLNACKCGGRAYRFVLLGAPGVGKGTVAQMMAERLGLAHLATGDIFRAAKSLPAASLSPALQEAIGYMQRGELVPDQTVIDLVRERRACLHWPAGFVLDGFPRTVPQAEAFEQLMRAENLALDGVLNFELPIETIVARLGGRRTCSKCKAVYHVVNMPPKVDGICDNCGGPLIIREDDRPDAIRVRMDVYQKSTAPLIEYYRSRNMLITISAEGTPDDVFARTCKTAGIRCGGNPC